MGAIFKLTCLHAFEQIQVFFNRAVTIRAFNAGLRKRATHFTHLLGTAAVNVSLFLLDQLAGKRVQLVEVVRCVAKFIPLKSEPGDVGLYGIDILFTLLRRISIVKAKIAGSVELFRYAEIQADRLHMANVKIAVRLWRKSCFDLAIVLADFQIFSDDIPDEIAGHDGL